jgi:hypothetical protein
MHQPPGHPPRQLRLPANSSMPSAAFRRLNERCEPFTWTKDLDAILTGAQRAERLQTHGTRLGWYRP